MAESKVKPQTPGGNPPAKQMPPQDVEQSAAAGNEPTPQEVEITPEIQALIAAERDKAIKEFRRKMMVKPEQAGDLPDQSDFDANKIKRAVLTKDGYLCPNPPPEEPGRRMR